MARRSVIDAQRVKDKIKGLPVDQAIEVCRLALRDQYLKSLYQFSTRLLGYKDITKATHGDMIRCLEANTPRKLIIMPRGTFKSTVSSICYPTWLLMKDPDKRILIDSELYKNSTTYLSSIKAHFEDERFKYLFGESRNERLWNEGQIIINQRKKVLKEASITCGGIGTVKVGQHYDVIIGDDYNSPRNSGTPEAAMKVLNHYKYNQSILEPDGTYIIVMTRYSGNDICGEVLRTQIDIQDVDADEESWEYIAQIVSAETGKTFARGLIGQ